MSLRIEGPEWATLSAAIENAFNPATLQQVLKFKLNENIYSYDEGKGYNQTRYKLIEAYNGRHQIDKLVAALLEHVPDNGDLLNIAWRHQILKRPASSNGSHGPADDSLERMLDPQRGFTDAGAMLQRLGQVVNCVCQITVPVPKGIEYGTGFLIGDSTVLTNWHVVEHVNNDNRKSVRFLFDYRTGPDGKEIAASMASKLLDHDTNWLIDHSTYHADDARPASMEIALAATRPSDHLDYAVLRLADAPGSKPVGAKSVNGGQPRGFLSLQEAATDPADFEMAKAALFIFQHPFENGKSLPLQVDWNKPAILGVNANETRVLYDVNTLGGSSGSPCFNAKLELIALHHAGGKDWPAANMYRFNQGIPIRKIIALLQQSGKLADIQ